MIGSRQRPPPVGRPGAMAIVGLKALLLALSVVLVACGDARPETRAVSAPGTDDTADSAPPTGTGDAARPSASTTSTSDPPAPPQVIEPSTITATASTELPPTRTLTYGVENLFDGDPETAWNHDSGRAEAIGQSLEFTFDQPTELTEIRIVNGYIKSDEVFLQNARVRRLTITSDRPGFSFDVDLADDQAAQSFEQDYGTVMSVRLEIVSIYPGSRYGDVALSSVEFVGRQPPSSPDS